MQLSGCIEKADKPTPAVWIGTAAAFAGVLSAFVKLLQIDIQEHPVQYL
jgi:hypothetical protein